MPFITEEVINIPRSPLRKPYGKIIQLGETQKVHRADIGNPVPPPVQGFGDGSYGSSAGEEGLRKIIASMYSYGNIKPEDVVITHGASSALKFLIRTTIGHDTNGNLKDTLLTIEPFYPPMRGFLAEYGLNLATIPTRLENNFELPKRSEIERIVNKEHERMGGILLTSPSNPVGDCYTEEELKMFYGFARKLNQPIITDSVYRHLAGKDYIEPFKIIDPKHNADIIGFAKMFGLAGEIRIGAVVTKSEQIKEGVLKLNELLLCVSKSDQRKAIEAYKAIDPEAIRRETFEKVYLASKCLKEDRHYGLIEAHTPKYGYYFPIKCITIPDTEEFLNELLDSGLQKNDPYGETTTFVPMEGFYLHPSVGTNQIRYAVANLPKEGIPASVESLVKGIRDNNEQNITDRRPYSCMHRKVIQ